MQANLGDASGTYGSPLRAAAAVAAEGGWGRLWLGLLPRGTRIVCATLVLSKMRALILGRLEAEEEGAAHEAPAGGSGAAARAAAR